MTETLEATACGISEIMMEVVSKFMTFLVVRRQGQENFSSKKQKTKVPRNVGLM